MSLDCVQGPLPAFSVLPFLRPGRGVVEVLEAVGGTAPYRWSAQGLPEGVTLAEDGVFVHDGSATAGRTDVTVTVVDVDDLQSERTFELVVGVEEACGDLPVLPCDGTQSLTGTFETSYQTDPVAGSLRVCVDPGDSEIASVGTHSPLFIDADSALGVFLPPGEPDASSERAATVQNRVEFGFTAEVLSLGIFPPEELYDSYRGHPLVAEIRSPGAGDYQLCASCEYFTGTLLRWRCE